MAWRVLVLGLLGTLCAAWSAASHVDGTERVERVVTSIDGALAQTAYESCLAENTPAASPPRSPPPFLLFRYDEDYSVLVDDAQRTDLFDALRYRSLNDDGSWRLTVGGEARARYEYLRRPGWGLRGLDRDDLSAQRLLLHADLQAGERVRGFVQVLAGFQVGNESPTVPTQDNALDVQQAFVDVVLVRNQDTSFTIRGGRQEMGFGSYRLVTPRDATNARLNFDGVRATLATGETSVDAFVTRPVLQERGLLNDNSNREQAFWGVYASTPIIAQLRASIDVYYLGLDRTQTRYEAGIDDETRHSVGARLWGRPDHWDYDFEAVYQFGTWGDVDISAWTMASNTGYTWKNLAWTPRLGLKANIASGDTDASDDRLGTFNALFPRNNYFNDANLVTPANFFDLHPSVQISPIQMLTLTAAADFFFRYSTADAVYSPGRIGILADASDERFVGIAATLQADWTITHNLSWTLTYTRFFSGSVVSDAGGDDVEFLGTWLTFRF
jgi:hypothetical protein